MPITVHIPTAFRRFTGGQATLESSAATLAQLFGELEQRFPELKPHLRDGAGVVRPFLNLYVNDEDIRFLGGETYRFQAGDEVMLVPSIAGGAPAQVCVEVPATSANLGCAFDCAALALNLYLKARATPTDAGPIAVRYHGANPERVPEDESNLVAQGIRRFAAWAARELPACRVEIENEIPVCAGLGSSAAAVVAGLLLGARLCGVQADADTLLPLAAELEGHPDNVTAALHGGLTFAAALDGLGKVLAWKARIEPPWKLVVVVPELGMPTRAARAVLPESCSRADAVHNLQRVALLAAQCASGRFAFVPELFDDRLHQPYRTARVPGLDACLKLRHPELFGICLSGSGAAVVAFARAAEHEIARRLVEEFAGHGVAAREFHVQVENRGARVVDDAAARKSRRQSAARVPAGSLGPW